MIKKAFTYGIFSGIIISLYYALLYMGGIDTLANWWLALLIFPIVIFLMFYFSVRVRKEMPELPFNYGQAFQTLFIVGVTASFVTLLWNLLLFNVIDKDLGAQLTERIIENTMEFMEKMGTPESAMDEALAEMGDMGDKFKPAGQVISWLQGFIFYAIIAAIGALIIRRKKTTAPLDVM